MTHEEARLLIGGDPEDTSEELLAHLQTCPECQAYRQQMLALNAKLRRALELDWSRLEKSAPPGAPPTTAAGATAAPASTAAPTAAPRSNPTDASASAAGATAPG